MGISRTGFYSHAWLFLRWCIWNWGVFLSAVICPAPMCVGESYCGLLIGNQKMMLWSTTVGLWELLATTISNENLSDMTLVEMFTDKLMFERFIPVRWVRFAHFHPLTHRTFPGDQIETNLTFFWHFNAEMLHIVSSRPRPPDVSHSYPPWAPLTANWRCLAVWTSTFDIGSTDSTVLATLIWHPWSRVWTAGLWNHTWSPFLSDPFTWKAKCGHKL